MASYVLVSGKVVGPVNPSNPFYAIQAALSLEDFEGQVVVLHSSGTIAGYSVERVVAPNVSTNDVDTMTRAVTYTVTSTD